MEGCPMGIEESTLDGIMTEGAATGAAGAIGICGTGERIGIMSEGGAMRTTGSTGIHAPEKRVMTEGEATGAVRGPGTSTGRGPTGGV